MAADAEADQAPTPPAILPGINLEQDILPTEYWATMYQFGAHPATAKEQAVRAQYLIRNTAQVLHNLVKLARSVDESLLANSAHKNTCSRVRI
jgi:hypothetical protein